MEENYNEECEMASANIQSILTRGGIISFEIEKEGAMLLESSRYARVPSIEYFPVKYDCVIKVSESDLAVGEFFGPKEIKAKRGDVLVLLHGMYHYNTSNGTTKISTPTQVTLIPGELDFAKYIVANNYWRNHDGESNIENKMYDLKEKFGITLEDRLDKSDKAMGEISCNGWGACKSI